MDPRFDHISTDPRFQGVPRKKRKVSVDARFKSMFNENRFKVNYKVDKRGRGTTQSSSTDDLKRYYKLSDNEEDNESNVEEEEEESTDSSTDIDEDGLNELNDIEYFSEWLDQQSLAVPKSEDISHRLALCNMNWDRITAQDLYVLFNSFRSKNGVIQSVTIYPSDFGIERMKHEDKEGPSELLETLPLVNEDDPGHIEGRDFSHDKLREYQLNRLKYYYAIIECDSVATAEHIYNECDGLEYELSSSTIDLRFVPDEVTFDDRKPSSVATESSLIKDYKPSEFLTTALQQSTVQFTWDETHPSRLQTTMKKYNKDELGNADFDTYLASSSSDDETTDRDIYRSLLGLDDAKHNKEAEEGEELEITWNTGLSDKVNNSKDNNEDRQESQDGFNDPFFADQELNKKRNKKRKNKLSKKEQDELEKEKGELELLVMSDNEDEKQHFSIDKILQQEKKESAKKKRKKRKENEQKLSSDVTDFKIDLDDPRFSAVFNSHHYAIDPSHHQYKPTNGMKALLQKRSKANVSIDNSSTLSHSASLKALMESVKKKSKSFPAKHRK